MAFDDLTPNQIKAITQLIEALNSGSYTDEFVMGRRLMQQRGFIHLYGKDGVADREIKGFTESDVQALKEEKYITVITGGRASLKPRAYQQYELYMNQTQTPKALTHNMYLRLLAKVYNAIGDNLRKSVNLAVVLKDEGLSQSQLESVTEYMEGEGWVEAMSDEGLDVYIKHPGIKAAQSYSPSFTNITSETPNMTTPKDTRNVFVVHGRNTEARKALFGFLRSIKLSPLEWSQAIKETGKASPFIGEILDVAFSKAQAVVVLMTPDDVAQLREPFRSASDPVHESQLTGQARPNVLFEAGMAMGRNPDRTIIVELGMLRPFSDIAGRHTVRLSNDSAARQELAQRLETAGCPVDLTGRDWHTEGDFDIPSVKTVKVTRRTSKATQTNVGSALVSSPKKKEANEAVNGGKSVDQIVPEFEEIKANIITSTLAHVIAAELKRLKTFIHRHSFLLNRSDVDNFYSTWIAPLEVHLEYEASLDLKQAQYEHMKAQLARIDLRFAPLNTST